MWLRQFGIWLLLFAGSTGREPPGWDVGCCPNYDVGSFVEFLAVQFCTLVEVGQGYCSLFLEFRLDETCSDMKPGSFAEIYLGTCECAIMRSWELCSVPLKKARPYECSFENEARSNSDVSRVHRRLCDPSMMAKEVLNQPCDCTRKFNQRSLYPVEGFITCYRAPMPKSICTTHSVCGVANCFAKSFEGLAIVRCDPDCLGRQPFCEELGPTSSLPPIVKSFWSQWTCTVSNNRIVEVSESICLDDESHAPAFDCLGPGFYCCPLDSVCLCETTTTMTEMKITRYKLDLDPQELHGGSKLTANIIAALPEPLRRLIFNRRFVNHTSITTTDYRRFRNVQSGP